MPGSLREKDDPENRAFEVRNIVSAPQSTAASAAGIHATFYLWVTTVNEKGFHPY